MGTLKNELCAQQTQTSLIIKPVYLALNGESMIHGFFMRAAKALIRLDWANAQSDQSLRSAHRLHCWFYYAQIQNAIEIKSLK